VRAGKVVGVKHAITPISAARSAPYTQDQTGGQEMVTRLAKEMRSFDEASGRGGTGGDCNGST
jgi:hypothetical protein